MTFTFYVSFGNTREFARTRRTRKPTWGEGGRGGKRGGKEGGKEGGFRKELRKRWFFCEQFSKKKKKKKKKKLINSDHFGEGKGGCFCFTDIVC